MKRIAMIIIMIGILAIGVIAHNSSELVQLKLNIGTSVEDSTPTEVEIGTPTSGSGIDQSSEEAELASTPDQLIRFHVLANSDSEQDQAMKRAVRDAILKEVSPQLAVSQSLDESRQILKKVSPDMVDIARSVVKAWGKDYAIHTEYGHFSFPTKSYGTLVLPAGEYEALRIVIGKGQGSNWWCVLFPPLCFIDIDHSTAVQVDGKPGVPIKKDSHDQRIKQTTSSTAGSPKVRFYFWEKINRILG